MTEPTDKNGPTRPGDKGAKKPPRFSLGYMLLLVAVLLLAAQLLKPDVKRPAWDEFVSWGKKGDLDKVVVTPKSINDGW